MKNEISSASPKRRDDEHISREASAYNYYAAFSHTFVAKLIDELHIGNNDLLMDPWNGRGTTTAIAAEKGLSAIGFDLNPAMVAMAEARLVDRKWAKQALQMVDRVTSIRLAPNLEISGADGLLRWLTPASVVIFRRFQEILYDIVEGVGPEEIRSRETLIKRQRLNFFLNLSLCSTLRDVISPLRTSNPTWIPQKLPPQERLRPSAEMILSRTKGFLRTAVSGLPSLAETAARHVTVQQADSRFIPLPARSVSAVISSPSYCTRIDYAVATSPELFLLDLVSNSSFRALRERLLGTTITHIGKLFLPPKTWGQKCIDTIAQMRKHPSKASGSYYAKNSLQYFSGLHDSLEEIDRVSMPKARMAFVVQDSYYKEIHIDLSGIVREMGEALQWRLESKRDYPIASTMAASNPGSRTYRNEFGAVESVLIFSKEQTNSRKKRGK